MAFPNTPILDNFNRADAATLGSNWTTTFGQFKITSNICALTSLSTFTNASWNVSQYGSDLEAYVTLKNATAVSDGRIYLRTSGLDGDSSTGYNLAFDSFASTLQVRRQDAGGAETQLGATISQALVDNDSIGISMVGSTISVYYKASAGSWTLLTTRSDSTYLGSGYLGLEGYSDNALPMYKDFGGGSLIIMRKTLTPNGTRIGSRQTVIT